MKKIIIAIAALLMLAGAAIGFFVIINIRGDEEIVVCESNGWLSVDGENIVDSCGKIAQLKGISTHGIQWFGNLYNTDSIHALKQEMGINVFRVAMYSDPNANGYVANRSLKEKVYELVDASIVENIYVIIDWHILNDNNPQAYKAEALEFFAEVSAKYADDYHVIYEICNEPNNGADWENDIYPYAKEVVAGIRENSPNSLVIVGTANYSKDLYSVARKPLEEKNVAYALHFYAGSHNKVLRDEMDAVREKGLALFVSECGATDASGAGELYEDGFERWVKYMNERGISWVYWSYSNKDEASAMLKKDAVPDYKAEDFSFDEYLSPSGELIRRMLR